MDEAKTAAPRRARQSTKSPEPADIFGAVVRFVARCGGWAAVILAMNFAAPYTGVSLALNAYSVAACGALGVPGLGLLLCASAMF